MTAIADVATPGNGKKKELTLRDELNSPSVISEIAKALPKHMSAERMCRIAMTALTRTPKLANCTKASFFKCMIDLSQLGLEPDGRRAHLIPFDVRKKEGNNWVVDHTDCTLIVDYKGYVELALRSGKVANIHADIVCDNDDFEYDRGVLVRHRINFREPRGNAYAAYALIRFKDGSEKCEVMSREDILSIRDRSQGWIAFKKKWANQSPWDPDNPTSEHEMWKKTAFRRATKWIELSPELRDVIDTADAHEPITIEAGQSQSSVRRTEQLESRLAGMIAQADEQQPSQGDTGATDEGQASDPQDN